MRNLHLRRIRGQIVAALIVGALAGVIAGAAVATTRNDEGAAGWVDAPCAGGYSPTLFAVDVESGKPRWSYCPTAPALFDVVAATDSLVFSTSSSGPRSESREVVVVDAAKGTERWRMPVPYQMWPPGSFAGSGVVVLVVADTGPSELAGLDAATGKARWRFASDFVPVGHTESMVIVARQGRDIRGLDRVTGQQRWASDVRLEDRSQIGVARAPTAMVGSTVVIPAGEQLVAVNSTNGAELWRAARLDHPSGHDGVVVGRDGDNVTALDAATGRKLWSAPGVPSYGEIWALGDGSVYVLSRGDGPGGPVVIAYDLHSGAERWRFIPSALLFGEPMAGGKDVMFVGWEVVAGAVSSRDGQTRWTFRPQLVEPAWMTGLTTNRRSAFISVDDFAPTD